jgi:hypothetical protein
MAQRDAERYFVARGDLFPTDDVGTRIAYRSPDLRLRSLNSSDRRTRLLHNLVDQQFPRIVIIPPDGVNPDGHFGVIAKSKPHTEIRFTIEHRDPLAISIKDDVNVRARLV